MALGMPGTWLDGEDLSGHLTPKGAPKGCGCRQPLIWDGKRGQWRHLDDGTPCVALAELEKVR